MRVQVLRSLGREWPDLLEGEIADVKDHVGDQLIAKGLAIRLEEPEPTIKGTPPEVAEDQPNRAAPKRAKTSRKS